MRYHLAGAMRRAIRSYLLRHYRPNAHESPYHSFDLCGKVLRSISLCRHKSAEWVITMNFNMAEIELLRLAGWCKALPQELNRFESSMLSPAGIQSLYTLKLLRKDKHGSIKLTKAGMEFLDAIGYHYPSDSAYISNAAKLRRRKQAAELTFTFYRAGIDVFADTSNHLQNNPVYLSSTAARRNIDNSTSKVWAGCRITGIARLGNIAYMLHYVDDQGIIFTSEMDLFHKLTMGRCERTACIYAAERYKDAVGILLKDGNLGEKKRGGWVSFQEACKRTVLPVHLLECSNIGAIQLGVMNAPNHRERIARLALASRYQPPYPKLPNTDAVVEGLPLVSAVDMDIKRIERACQEAKRLDYEKLLVVALPEQLDALAELFLPIAMVDLYSVPLERIMQEFSISLYEPSTDQYRTKEGGLLYASDIPPRRKAGRPPKQKA